MKLRPIIFSGPMVRAILDGRKTQTRRILTVPWKGRVRTLPYEPWYLDEDGRLMVDCDDEYREASECLPCPFGAVGDGLWVRETWGAVPGFGADRDHDDVRYVYRANPADAYQWDGAASQGFRWRSPILMPREASRLTLVVRSVRVERLSAITDEDAHAEGFKGHPVDGRDGCPVGYGPRAEFLDGFRAMHKLAADVDPWLWCVRFERMESAR